MREILFRGKDIKGNWYEGLLAHNIAKDEWYISNKAGISTAYQVRPETIGQFTGLTDKNGVKIFEGDVVRISEDYYDGLHYSGNEVYYSDGAFCVEYETPEYDVTSIGFLVREGVEVEVIGNIYDNPELIGEDGDTE